MDSDDTKRSAGEQGADAALSLDDQIKLAQRDKLQAEVRQLRGISMDTIGKLGVTVFGIVAAVFALWTGVPQTRLDLANAKEDLLKQRQELALRTADAASQAALADRKASEVQQKRAELKEAESLLARTADQLERLKSEVQAIEALQQSALAAGKPPAREVAQRIAQASKPLVFVQFAGGLSRDEVIKPLLEALASQGLSVPGAERIDRGQSNEVRYFSQNEEQRLLAQQVADTTQAYFAGRGCPLPSLAVKLVRLPGDRQSPVELWLMHNCPKP